MAIARLVLAITDPESAAPITDSRVTGGGAVLAVFELVTFTALAVIGALVASRRPRNPVGWILCATPLLLELGTLCEHLYWSLTLGHPRAAGVDLLVWATTWVWIPALIPFISLVPLLFPTGRPPGRRWRLAGASAVAGATFILLATMVTPGPMEGLGVDNPVGIAGLEAAGGALIGIGFLLVAAGTLGGAASLVHRFRRSGGIERQQLKWVTSALGLLAIVWSGMVGAGFVVGPDESGGLDVGWLVLVIALLVVTAAVATATLRYRLYDIDVVINRALVYGPLTATLAAAYLGAVLLLQVALAPLTSRSDLAIAGSTLAVAALFGPARARIQAGVDRRFYRSRYDAARTLEAFGAHLRDEVDLALLGAELQSVVGTTMQPAHVSLWLRAARS